MDSSQVDSRLDRDRNTLLVLLRRADGAAASCNRDAESIDDGGGDEDWDGVFCGEHWGVDRESDCGCDTGCAEPG